MVTRKEYVMKLRWWMFVAALVWVLVGFYLYRAFLDWVLYATISWR